MGEPLRKSTIAVSEAAMVSTICFGLFIVWSTQAVMSGFPEARFSDSSNIWMILIEFILAATALLYLYVRNFDIGSRGRALYSGRIATVEPVFANIRHNKRLARFNLCGRDKVNAQWDLYCLVHNIEKLAGSG